MSAPPFVQLGPPPLPPGWTEHVSPTGQPYYFNANTKESTYVRPLPSFPMLSMVAPAAQPKKKKEKPLVKTPIPGTEWIRVRTTEGNVFYTHKAKKESVWTVPEAIKDAVQALEKAEVLNKEKKRLEEEAGLKRAEEERMKEVERIKSEVEDIVGKRKAEEAIPVDEVVISKRPRVEEEEEEDEEEEEESEESEEEDWQREAAAQLATEAEDEKQRQLEEKKRLEEEALKAEEEAQKARPLNMPARVDLSIEEAKALFKTLLREKNVNPLHPWDTSLPLFISDPRYVLLPSVSARREAFDEYCRDRARELRQSQVKKEKESVNPKEEFERLLRDEVKSTRTSWTEWRRQWKKDRRFYVWGRDDREREKKFREYLKELGERKRAAAQKAETDFFALLKENNIVKSGAAWKDVKKKIADDIRYDAVGSSSLREELYNTFIKASVEVSVLTPGPNSPNHKGRELEPQVDDESWEEERGRKLKERKDRAVRDREQKVRDERTKVEAEIGRSRMGLNKEEGELDFRTLLIDAVRDPQISWDAVLPQLRTDPRLTRSGLPLNRQLHIFHEHIGQLRAKHLAQLHALFASHAPSLATAFNALSVESLLSSPPASKLGLDIIQLEKEYDRWQRERTHEARVAFDRMLGENAFVEFWGRLGKIGGKGVDQSIKVDDLEDDEAEEIVDMKALAKTVDLKEMVKVLKNDKRYLMFDHVPEQRERWLRDYLSQLSAPKLSVHVA